MEESIDEDLLKVGPEKFVGECVAIDVVENRSGEGGDFLARQVFHRENQGRAVVVYHLRDHQQMKFLEVRAQLVEVACFLVVIELPHEAAAKFREDPPHLIPTAELRVFIEEFGDFLQALEVGNDLLADVWPSEAAPSGSLSKCSNAFEMRTPSCP